MSLVRASKRVDWGDWRTWPGNFARFWRESLQFRTVLISIVLSGLAVLGTGLYMSSTIGADLFSSRLEQALNDSTRATASAQKILDASDASESVALKTVLTAGREAIAAATSSRLIAIYRTPGQEPSSIAPQNQGTRVLNEAVTRELRTAVQNAPELQHWQSVTLTSDDGVEGPGIVVGSQLLLPSAGRYELYVGYSMADIEQTLLFIQRTLFLSSLALMVFIGFVTGIIVRYVVNPIRVTAETSRKLAAGDLAVRIPVKGVDEFSTLARSFNGMADSLQSRIRELAELSLVQQRFVSDVSHELRTPLTTIRLAGDVLYDQRESFPQGAVRPVELLHTQVERFELLLADLLEISRYDAGSVALEIEPTNLVRLAEDAIDSLAAVAEQHGSHVRLVAPGGYFASEMDPRRIRRIVHNLLGNAIEHGEGRPIVVSVDSNQTAVALSVRDYGIGMTADAIGKVFERFWRADPSRKRTLGGTGLGLAIALEDANLHHGRLEVWSEPGLGSSFLLTLPRTPDAEIGQSPLPLEPADLGGVAPAVEELVEGTDLAEELRTGSIGTTLAAGGKTKTSAAAPRSGTTRTGGQRDAHRS